MDKGFVFKAERIIRNGRVAHVVHATRPEAIDRYASEVEAVARGRGDVVEHGAPCRLAFDHVIALVTVRIQ